MVLKVLVLAGLIKFLVEMNKPVLLLLILVLGLAIGLV
jgi:hypothetical protein